MERMLSLIALVAALGALGVAVFLRPASEAPREAETVVKEVVREGTPAAAAAPDGQVLLLKDRLDKLAARVAELEQRPVAAAPVKAVAPAPVLVKEDGNVDLAPLTARLDGLERKVDDVAAKIPAPVASALTEDEAAREAVSNVVKEQLDKVRDERRERRRVIGDQVMDEMANDFANRANLSDEQFNNLYPALNEMRQAMRENFSAMRRGEKDFAEVRESGKQAREKFEQAARSILDDEQFKLYQKEMEERFGGRGMFH